MSGSMWRPNRLQIDGMGDVNRLQVDPWRTDADPLKAGAPTLADAWRFNADAMTDWMKAQKAKSAEMGLYNPETGWPTMKGWGDAAQQYASTFEGGIKGYHGSPHSFDKFSMDKIGTGEGAQAYGHGLYFAEREGTARSYRTGLSGDPTINGRPLDWSNPGEHAAAMVYDAGSHPAAVERLSKEVEYLRGTKGYDEAADPSAAALRHLRAGEKLPDIEQPGHMYEVNINADPEHFLHWDKPLSEQSPHVQQAVAPRIEQMRKVAPDYVPADPSGDWIYKAHTPQGGVDLIAPGEPGFTTHAAETLRNAGIPGIRYLDQGSRSAGEGSHNIVAFDENTIEILRKYGLAGLGLGGAAAATAGAQEPGQ